MELQGQKVGDKMGEKAEDRVGDNKERDRAGDQVKNMKAQWKRRRRRHGAQSADKA